GGRGRAGADVRRRLGVDREPVRRLPRLPAAGRRPGGVQRPVHAQPDGASRRARGPPPGAPPPHPPPPPPPPPPVGRHPAPPGPAVAVHRRRPGERRMRTLPALHDTAPATHDFRLQVLLGLGRRPKELPCKFFYDERGSQLFDAICDLDEYYPTRTELAIM